MTWDIKDFEDRVAFFSHYEDILGLLNREKDNINNIVVAVDFGEGNTRKLCSNFIGTHDTCLDLIYLLKETVEAKNA